MDSGSSIDIRFHLHPGKQFCKEKTWALVQVPCKTIFFLMDLICFCILRWLLEIYSALSMIPFSCIPFINQYPRNWGTAKASLS